MAVYCFSEMGTWGARVPTDFVPRFSRRRNSASLNALQSYDCGLIGSSNLNKTSAPVRVLVSPYIRCLGNFKRREALLCTGASLAGQRFTRIEAEGKIQQQTSWYGRKKRIGKDYEPIQYDCSDVSTSVIAPGRRIVAIGDLHGDLQRTEWALRLAGVLSSDGQDHWIGGTTVLVQLGDILDRGEDEIAIMSLLHNLDRQACLQGGAIFQINGNHETMNVGADFRFVEAGGFEEAENFVEYAQEEHGGDWEAAFAGWRVSSRERKASIQRPFLVSWLLNPLKMQKGAAARTFLFTPGGPLAQQLGRFGVVLKVNDWLFAHGGVLPHHVQYGLQKLNREVVHWMRNGKREVGHGIQLPFLATRGFDSIVWSRIYSRDSDKLEDKIKSCAVLEAALDAANAKGLVVGHTPQPFGANCECKGRVWRIDVGMSSGVLHAKPEVLEIHGDEVKVISASDSALENTHT